MVVAMLNPIPGAAVVAQGPGLMGDARPEIIHFLGVRGYCSLNLEERFRYKHKSIG